MQWFDASALARWIELLDEYRFVDLANALLSETAARNEIDRSCLATNLRVKEPDGGIDARCEGAPRPVGRLIPRTSTVYQFKAGQQKKSSREIVEEDILAKPRVIDALRPAVVASRAQPGDALENAIRENVRFTARNLTADSPVLRADATRGRLRIARAEYALATGHVTFF